MARVTKAMLEDEVRFLKRLLDSRNAKIIALEKQVEALQFPNQVINTVAMTVQRTASLVESVIQSIPAVDRYASRTEGKEVISDPTRKVPNLDNPPSITDGENTNKTSP